MSHGIAGYWQANSVTFDSAAFNGAAFNSAALDGGNRVTVSPMKAGPRGEPVPDIWEIDLSQLDAARNFANFLMLTSDHSTGPQPPITIAGATIEFGKPAREYRYGQYTILVWDKNILSLLPAAAWPNGF